MTLSWKTSKIAFGARMSTVKSVRKGRRTVIRTIIFIGVGAILAVTIVLWLMGERWRLLRRSTGESLKAGGLRNALNFRSLHTGMHDDWSAVRRFREHHPRAEHERGHVHTAWFKDALLNRFYAICNCCKCCCGGIEAMVKYGVPMLAPSGYVARVDTDNCIACATCEDACPFGAIQMDGTAIVNWDVCMGCGVCVGQCPSKAMSLSRDERKGIPLDVRLLAKT